ncbi:proline-rich protein HaeIII subfamily 1-like [Hyaena hyaena]|uniref:proline-rich protein HaeIII subfamily 1-like n=1 Tax=Hyaena hyaena TaxID=95912 RepID=UPI001922D7B7|nr:proline-rich protein HaeIII subfamily 1-like [Hyaena hyaena]
MDNAAESLTNMRIMKVPGLSKRNIQMINPKTGGRRGQAEQDFQSCSATTFSATVRLPASGLRAVAAGTRVRPAGATHPAPRPRQAAPPGPGPSLPRSAPSPCPRGACGPGSVAWGPGVRGEPAEDRGAPFPARTPQSRNGKHAPWNWRCGRRRYRAPSWAGGALPRRSRARPPPALWGRELRPAPPAAAPPPALVAPGKRSGAAPGCSNALLPAPGKLSRSARCPRFLAVGNARSPASPHSHPDRFFDLYPEWVPAVSVCLPDFTP